MFAFVWYEQGTMLSKGRLRPADAREVVQHAGGAPDDPIALIAIHDDADTKYADCKGVVVPDGQFHVFEDLIIDPNDGELGRVARLSEGAYELRAEEARALWGRVTNASVQFLPDKPGDDDLSGFNIANRATTDIWTRDDTLGYAKYAQAIADSILLGNAPPPLTVGIQAPWGQGKTSLMRMIQARLDPAAVERERLPRTANPRVTASVVATYGELLSWMRDPERIRRRLRAFGARLSAWLERRLVKHSDTTEGLLQPGPDTIPSVWFNPLYYRETSQVWAGLAHAILYQLAEQLPTATQREEFWLRLQVSRINVAAVRRDIHLWLLTRAIPRGLFWIAVGIAFVLIPNLSDVVRFFGLGGSALAAGLHVWSTIEKRTVDRPFEKYVSEPAYQTELGLLYLVDHDLDRALRLLVHDRPIAVFIDDLDRCDPQTVKQVVLAINQFLSLPNRNVYFFLGMDMEMVAASLEEAQKSSPELSGRRQGFGWRFMEKFIQLPFVIPHLDPKTAQNFAAGHLRGIARTGVKAAKPIDIDAQLAAIDRASATSEIGRIAREVAGNHDIPPADRARLEERFSRRTTQLMQDPESEEIQKIVDIAIRDLDLNPRTIKRYFSLVRVLRNIQISTGAVTDADSDRKIVLRAAHLLLNWPQFVQWLRNTPELADSGARTIDEIVRASGAANRKDWAAELKKILGVDPPSYLADPALHRFLSRIAKDGPGLQKLYEGGLF